MTNTIVILALGLTAYLAAGHHWWRKAVMGPMKRAVLEDDDFDAAISVANVLEKTVVHRIVFGSFLLLWPGFLLAGFILSRFAER